MGGPEKTHSKPIRSASGLVLSMGFYPPNSHQDAHAHHFPSVSLVLSGAVHETVGRREEQATSSFLSVKPPGVRHSDAYGPDGSVILSLAISDPQLWSQVFNRPEWRWQALDRKRYGELLSLFACPTNRSRRPDVVFDILALAAEAKPRSGTAPAWLRAVRERLHDETTTPLAQIARESGVHRVYLARCFRQWYGMPPSLYRVRLKTAAAIGGALFHKDPAASVAQHSGFADQSHMARAIRGATGHSLSGLRALSDSSSSVHL